MSVYGPLVDVVVSDPVPQKGSWIWATCPSCGLRGRIDTDQYMGEVSVDCPECDYHETHDHRETE